MFALRDIKESLFQLFFPHICSGCSSNLLNEDTQLCMECILSLPETNFHYYAANPVEKIFWGRLPLVSATAQYYFSKESLMQTLMHQVKYKRNKELGRQLGLFMGNEIIKSNRFKTVDVLVPLPLFPAKEKKRGYNQATILCEGMAEAMKIEIANDVIIRPQPTETQTKKGRMDRWKNMEGKFALINADKLKGKHVLLVDDVVTTGATLEACGQELLKAEGIRVSIATLCYTSR